MVTVTDGNALCVVAEDLGELCQVASRGVHVHYYPVVAAEFVGLDLCYEDIEQEGRMEDIRLKLVSPSIRQPSLKMANRKGRVQNRGLDGISLGGDQKYS